MKTTSVIWSFHLPNLLNDPGKGRGMRHHTFSFPLDFTKPSKKGNIQLEKRNVQKIPSDAGRVELIPHLQKILSAIDNLYSAGVEGLWQ